MYRVVRIISVAFCLFLLSDLKSQDVHLSQFESSPLFLNPALGGQYSGDWQIGNSLREQWRSIDKPYQSYVLFYDRRFHYYSQELNGGIVFVHDQSGNAQLTAEKIYLSLAYPISRGRSTISIGIQPGLVMRSYNDNLTYPGQYDQSIGYFNPDLSNGENASVYGNSRRNFFDLNTGFLWVLHTPKFRPSVGIAFLHLNQADESFNENGDEMAIRQNIHANSYIFLEKNIYLKPSFYFSGQKKAHEMLLGADVGKKLKMKDIPVKELFAGLYIRNGYNRNFDAFMPMIGMQYNHWRFGLSYDITLSELKQASNYQGAFEVSVIYRAPSTSPKHATIPCDRY